MPFLSRPTLFLAPLLLLQFVFVIAYLAHEQAIPFWDYAMYANMALNLYAQPTLVAFWQVFAGSFAQNYNLLFALPSLLTFPLFGASRETFIATNFVFFFLAHEAAIALVLKRVFAIKWGAALLWAAGLCSLVPFMWYPQLQGYPDSAAAACLLFAFGFLLGSKRGWKDLLIVGGLLGLSIVLRRHYAYPALAVLVTLGSFDLFALWQKKPKQVWPPLRDLGLTYGCVGAASLFVLLALEPFYVKEMLTTSFAQLYKAYERPPFYFVSFLFSRIGFVLFIAVTAGFALLLQGPSKHRRKVAVVLALAPVWLLLWLVGPSQAGEHYLISIVPLVCVVGLYGLFHKIRFNQKPSYYVLITGLVLLANAAQSFWLSPFVVPSEKPKLSFFGTPRPPWVRKDYDALLALAAYIGETTTEKDRIVVAGSSFVLNQDLLRAAYTDALKTMPPAFRFVMAPESDSSQEAPLDAYATANVYVVASPTQYHLAPDKQTVVTALAARFPPAVDESSLFEKDEQSFALMDGVTVSVWRRKAWTPAALHQGLLKIREIAPASKKWVATATPGVYQYGNNAQAGEVFAFRHAGLQRSSLFYDEPLKNGPHRVQMVLQKDGACQDVSLQLIVKATNGKTLLIKTASPFQDRGPFFMPFTIESRQEGPFYVSLDVTSTSASFCTVALWQLNIEH